MARSGSTPTHLHYRLDDGRARERQVLAIDEAIRGLGRDRDSAPQILCGDFNAIADSDEIRFLRWLTTLGGRRTHFQDAWLRLHREPEPGDGPAEGITWSSENRFTRPLRSISIAGSVMSSSPRARRTAADGPRLPGRAHRARGIGEVAICASDHYGVCADIQITAPLG